jgi:glycosyltransferase involved in cell wall biosynthesis
VGGRLIPFPADTKNPAALLFNGWRLRGLIEREGVDLVHARSRAPAWSGWLAARRTGRPFVTTYHGAYGEKGPFKRAYNRIMARGDLVIANSRYTADLIRARYATEETRIRVIHRGIDEMAFDPASVSAERIRRLRQAWALDGDERIILLAARLTGWKGQSVLIAAAALLERELGGVRFILAGDAQGRSGYVASLERQIEEAGVGSTVRLVGHVADMPAAFLAAHASVVASTEPEAFGRAAAEAQAMGCPVIATSIGASPETIKAEPACRPGEITGWLIPPSDPAALADRLRAALALSTSERAAIGARARSHIMQSFSLTRMQLATLRVYDELIGSTLEDGLKSARGLSSAEA